MKRYDPVRSMVYHERAGLIPGYEAVMHRQDERERESRFWAHIRVVPGPTKPPPEPFPPPVRTLTDAEREAMHDRDAELRRQAIENRQCVECNPRAEELGIRGLCPGCRRDFYGH